MPSTTDKYSLPYPLLEDANNPPADFRTLAEKIEIVFDSQQSKAEKYARDHSNQICVNGTWYELSGFIPYPSGSWTTVTTNVFVRTIQIERPYTPPAGYGFNYFIANSTSYSFASTGSFAGDDKDAVRILQFSSNSQTAIKSIGWILVKIGDE